MSVYEGHGVTLHHGDCLDVLRSLPDCSVDSVVTDPPYGLEFMGKEWDKFRTDDPGTNRHRGERAGKQGETVGNIDESLPSRPSGVLFDPTKKAARGVSYGAGKRPTTNVCEGCGKRDQFRNPHACPDGTAWRSQILNPHAAPPSSLAFGKWCELWTAECLRVLKPGGHLLAFGGTRTWHRLACAVEDAGFEIRDSIAWLYGCLSDDTEILTSEGWVRYDRAKEGQHALAFDTATGALAWQAIQHVHRYPYAGEMVRLHSEHTDQLLTPNHRVVLDEGRSTPHTPYVPSDQDLRRLLADVPGAQPLPVGAEDDVLAGVRGPADLAVKEGQDQASRRAGGPYGAVRDLQDGDVEAGRLAQAERGGVLLEPVQRCAPCGGAGEALPQGQGGLDRRQPGVLPGEDDRAEQPRMEGRRYRVQEARELCRSAVRASAGVGAADGPHGRVHHGAPATDGRPLRVPADQSGSHQPREPRSQGQPTGEPDPLAVEPGAQALRVGEDGGGRLLPSTGVTADVVDYAGVVWCITVPHGAFIARRNGLIFATGNSGFPKSLDVSKAIDKAAGAEREVVGPGRWNHVKGTGDQSAALIRPGNQHDITAPATDAAREWAGFGTALKPAFEPVVVARKPIQGTVAANVLAHGTGALNIDGCRIEHGGNIANADGGGQGAGYEAHNKPARIYGKGLGGIVAEPHTSGRWPANVILDESQAEALDEQSGTLTSGLMRAGTKPKGERETYGQDAAAGYETTRDTPADSGGASRFFYVAKADARERPRLPKRSLRLRDDLTPEQVDHVRARLVEAGVQVD